MKIMLVDDAKAVHSFITSILGSYGIEFEHCYDGAEAVGKVKSSEFDLILLDWEMPEKDGITTLKEIRGSGNDTPIVMVTSKNDVSGIQDAIMSGANEYVMKPFTKDIIVQKISAVIPSFAELVKEVA